MIDRDAESAVHRRGGRAGSRSGLVFLILTLGGATVGDLAAGGIGTGVGAVLGGLTGLYVSRRLMTKAMDEQ